MITYLVEDYYPSTGKHRFYTYLTAHYAETDRNDSTTRSIMMVPGLTIEEIEKADAWAPPQGEA